MKTSFDYLKACCSGYFYFNPFRHKIDDLSKLARLTTFGYMFYISLDMISRGEY